MQASGAMLKRKHHDKKPAALTMSRSSPLTKAFAAGARFHWHTCVTLALHFYTACRANMLTNRLHAGWCM